MSSRPAPGKAAPVRPQAAATPRAAAAAIGASAPPCTAFNFQVTIGGAPEARAFLEVVFPPFVARPPTTPAQAAAVTPAAAAPPAHLLLRRAYAGSLDLHDWWNDTREARRPRGRVVAIDLLNATRRAAVLRWRFTGCVPVSLAYSPLNALESTLLVETLELAYARVDLSRPGAARR